MDLEIVRRCAEVSVLRGLGFALLAVGCLVLSFAFDLRLALEVAATCSLLIGVILLIQALRAPTRDYRKTETWILVRKRIDLPPERRQQAIGSILQGLYRHYCQRMITMAVAIWLVSVAVRLAWAPA
jgi:hypothetical protein